VTVDGVPRAALPRATYLAAVSAVRQAPALFTDTVANNIAYGAVAYRPVSRADVERAAQLANADAFIRRLPDGYDTVIGDGAGQVMMATSPLRPVPLFHRVSASRAGGAFSGATVRRAEAACRHRPRVA